MKRFGSIVAAVFFLSATAFAQTAPAPNAVALINFQRALAQNDEGVKAASAYTEEGKKLQAELTKYQAKVVELQDKLTKAPATISDADRNTLIKDIDKAKKDLEREQEDAQMAIDDKQDELFRPIADRVHKVIESYAKEKNLVLVLNVSDDMLYASDVVDITTEIIRQVNTDIVKNPAKH